ncbi:conserved hypothetical protein [Verticillium alfalfae VaMs.102]|uniref:Uncharacterized protein n=1 Tax=Verticillium alfalfae (strain VaMs.102 / ATCC MYA-4576 / FGSC 10136) TaxID=526221 RepID=C9SE15_VERA1|nr:conserved hypothetical protein [Verticillium alfalfae VaMs.102]EEY17262.1 conserved hypothetical protein [Verticillium alfalfae VaMs.102]
MDPMAGLTVYNLPPAPPRWDHIGIFYVTFCLTWTTIVFSLMAFGWLNRTNPVLRHRGVGLSFGAIFFLHCYWFLAQIVYPIGGTMPVILAYSIQYFFMGIWFPLGVALFHASNSRFLHVAKLQKQYMQPELRSKSGCNGADSSWICRFRNMSYTKKIMLPIGFGIVLQILLTTGMWLACRKYHPSWGIPGTEIRGDNLMEQMIDLGQGWEWWPSVLWQVIWTWIVAPILLYRAWGIRDTMGWRFQTVGCCLASLHATPMFMIACYVPAFQVINPYYPPSQWIHLSIMFFEIFTIIIPAIQVVQQRRMVKKSAELNAKWETSSQTTTLRTSTSIEGKNSNISLAEKASSFDYLDEELGNRLLTMAALDHVLNENPEPLQEFSALSDFSGENIAFLTRVTRWKSTLTHAVTEENNLILYNRAMDIYVDFISMRDAEFPLNLPSQQLKQLEEIFEQSTRTVLGEAVVNPATPFDFPSPSHGSRGQSDSKDDLLTETQYTGEIPAAFSPAVFDAAQAHIKYLVLTNTWPKFVAEMQSRRKSSETERTDISGDSQMTLASQVSSFFKRLI